MGGRFTNKQENRTTSEKKALVIVEVFEKSDHTISGPYGPNQVMVYTGPQKLSYNFAQSALGLNGAQIGHLKSTHVNNAPVEIQVRI